MARMATRNDFVNMVAEEVASGIDRALRYWLGRIEVELVDRSLTTSQRIDAIEQIVNEYKQAMEQTEAGCASA